MGQPYPTGCPVPPPPPPGRSRSTFPGWAIALIVAGSLVMLVCFGGLTAFLIGGIVDDPGTPLRSIGSRGGPAAPEVSASPVPLEPAGPPPADKTYTGRGNKTIDIDLDDQWLHIARITHVGSSNFMVETLDERGRYVDGIVNKIGDYDGVRLLDLRARETPKSLKIRADGRWTVTVQVADKAPKWTGRASGGDDAILAVDPEQAASRVRFTHRGRDNCALIVFGAHSSDLLVNEIGRYSGEMPLAEGSVFIDISASGSWTLDRV